jgi:hypothetical protein
MDEMIRSMAPLAPPTILPDINDSHMLLDESWFTGNYAGSSMMDQGDDKDAEEEDNYATEAEEVTSSLQVADHGYFKYMGNRNILYQEV